MLPEWENGKRQSVFAPQVFRTDPATPGLLILDGEDPLVPDPTQVSSTPIPTSPICNQPLYITITLQKTTTLITESQKGIGAGSRVDQEWNKTVFPKTFFKFSFGQSVSFWINLKIL